LQGKLKAETDVNATPQAYLLYIPTPGFSSKNFLQNNTQGYRGEAVSLARKPDTLRILFLGGSTTYGEGVENPADTYPAQLGNLLRQDVRFAGKQIEIINAGLRWGTTAEILTHYLLKFRYYHPDLVVINPGGNDPVAYTTPAYQPDYSNWRKSPQAISALRPYARWLLQSRFASAVIVMLFFPDIAEGTTFVHNGDDTPTRWFEPKTRGQLQLDELAFYNNLSTIVREIQHDGANVFLLSYQGNPYDTGDQEMWRKYYDYEESALAQISQDLHVAYAPFPLSLMPENLWVDPSHINAEGEHRKAAYIFPYVVPLLLTPTAAVDTPHSGKLAPLSIPTVGNPP
jgi:lysophospholipase L1-like esterase